MSRSTCCCLIGLLIRGDANTIIRWFVGDTPFIEDFQDCSAKGRKKMSKSRGAVRIRSESRTKRHSVIKLSRRSVDIINLLRARSSRANHRRAFNLGIHKYHDAERRRGNSRESRKRSSPLPSFFPSPQHLLFPPDLFPFPRFSKRVFENRTSTLTSS